MIDFDKLLSIPDYEWKLDTISKHSPMNIMAIHESIKNICKLYTTRPGNDPHRVAFVMMECARAGYVVENMSWEDLVYAFKGMCWTSSREVEL